MCSSVPRAGYVDKLLLLLFFKSTRVYCYNFDLFLQSCDVQRKLIILFHI